MVRKLALFAALVSPLFAAVQVEAAGYAASQRATIRSMPITQRPNRPGHFYGNTIRALNRIGIVR